MTAPRNFIVVPEGLALPTGAAPRLTHLFRGVLEATATMAAGGDRVFLAPANRFGTSVSEQAAAHAYLAPRTSAEVYSFEIDADHYLDTRDNAVLLRDWLSAESMWPLDNAVLIAHAVHLRRAAVVFRQQGYCFIRTIGVTVPADRGDAVVQRLWYQRYAPLHRLYEAVALVIFGLRLDPRGRNRGPAPRLS